MKKKLLQVLTITSITALGILTFNDAAKAGWGYQSWEHPVTNFSSTGRISQDNANKICRDSVYWRIDWQGGNFYDMEHKYSMAFVKFARPYVWAHVQNRHCVINASWGYVRY
jgi:hypothetical protein